VAAGPHAPLLSGGFSPPIELPDLGPPPGPKNRGTWLTGRIQPGLALVRMGRDTLYHTVRSRREPGAIWHQMYAIGNQSVVFITVTLGFLGMILVYQVATQVEKILPDFSMLGAAFLQVMIKEFAPTISGMMIATRVGSGIAAEIGSMVVTEQVDALRMCNADPVNYLVVPRFLAAGVMMLCLTVYAVLVGEITGMLTAWLGFGVHPLTFLSTLLVGRGDVVSGIVKAFAYGCAIPLIAGQAGMEATGGSEGVGWATTRAVVNASFAVVLLDFVISGLIFAIF
jgi:phospholipid/cholesterol/gamma-HCH transport system permease protein